MKRRRRKATVYDLLAEQVEAEARQDREEARTIELALDLPLTAAERIAAREAITGRRTE